MRPGWKVHNMRYFQAGSLVISLGLWAGSALGQENQPIVRMERPIALSATEATNPSPSSAVIGRPVAVAETTPASLPSWAYADPAIKTASFTAPPIITLDPPPIQTGGTLTVQPLPSGPVLDADGKSQQTPSNPVSRRLVPEPVEAGPAPRMLSTDPTSGPVTVNKSDSCDDETKCDDSCCGLFGCCGLFCRGGCFLPPASRFYMSAEYLGWWTKGQNFPALVTASPAGTPQAMAGVLGAPGTAVLLGGHDLDNGAQSGGRFTAGFWFDRDESIGLEGSYFFLANQTSSFDAGSNASGLPILARPFFDVHAGAEASELVSFPGPLVGLPAGPLAGAIHVSSTSQFQGADIDLRTNLWRGCCWRIDLLTGFRYLQLNNNLGVTENLLAPGGAGILVNDSFGTRNNFYGGQIGIDMQFRRGRWSLNLMEKIALGDTQEHVSINGNTVFMPVGGAASVQPGGLLALPTNIGTYSHNKFAIAPETGVKVGYQLTDHVNLFATYSFVYLNQVVDTAHVIDRNVNPTQLPSLLGPGTLAGPARPIFVFKSSDFWAQGVSIGIEFRY
jgi:hypothetical protein